MLTRCGAVLFGGLLGCCMLAAQHVATISSATPFQLRGVKVDVSGVPSWPAAIGDEVIAGSSPATVSFSDGSHVTLAAGTKAKIDRQDGRVTLRLLSGSGTYSVTSESRMRLALREKIVPVDPGSKGSLSLEGGAGPATGARARNRDDREDDDDQGLPPVSKHKKPKKNK